MSRIALKIGLRELSGGFKGFWIYLACLILGTAAIAAAGSVTEVFTRGLAGEARILLGGDAMFSMSQRRPDAQERAFMTDLGRITETAAVDLMATVADMRRQVDVRAADENYPLIGEVVLRDQRRTSKRLWSLKTGNGGLLLASLYSTASTRKSAIRFHLGLYRPLSVDA